MKIGIKVMPRKVVLDTQGRAVLEMLHHHGKPVEECRVGKFIELDVKAESKEKALEAARDIAEFVLYNPLIENYSMEVIE